MRNIFTALAILSVCNISANAQVSKDKTQIKQIEKKQTEKKTENVDVYSFKAGKISHAIAGKEFILQKDVTLKNGNVLHPDGTVSFKDGKKIKLKEGQSIDLNGNIKEIKRNRK